MMLSELKPNESGTVVKISADPIIKSRLGALGIVRGEKVVMLKFTLAKNTYEVMAGDSRIALRKEEADSVEVER